MSDLVKAKLERAGLVERVGEGLSRRLATRHSRRSFLGVIGGSSLTLAAGDLLAGPPNALANPCPGGCAGCSGGGHSVTCNDLPGWSANSCPPGTCACGFWDVCPGATSPCGGSTPIKRWHDCCGVNSCAETGCCSGAPTCCYDQEWHTSGACSPGNKIKCRFWTCQTSNAC